MKKIQPHEAIAESARCLLCHDAPCNKGCPAGIDVAGFIRNIKVKNFTSAYRKIRNNNILATTCGNICPSHKFCEANCSSKALTKPINIGTLHGFVADIELAKGLSRGDTTPAKGKRIAVIGSGPAGLSCAAELKMLGYEVTVFEKNSYAGGLMQNGIPPFKLPRNILKTEINHITNMGVELRKNYPIHDEQAIDKLFTDGYAAVFIGIGMEKPLRLCVPGEDLRGVTTWKEVLRQTNDYFTNNGGVPPDFGRRVAIIGGGNTALDVVHSILKLGTEVHLVCLEAIDEMPAFKSEIDRALEQGAAFHPRSRVLAIAGTDTGKVCQIDCISIEWKKTSDFSPQNAIDIAGSSFSMEVDSVVVAIGQTLYLEEDQFISSVELKNGKIVVDEETGQTSREGVFAGGDAIRTNNSVVQSVHDGATASQSIDKFLSFKG